MAREIPIRNIYYLLCYAWNRLAEGELVDVSGVDSTELVDLLATVLIGGTNHLLRRGLDQGYVAHEESLPSVRGRIDVLYTARRLLATHGKAHCRFDELTVNTLPNQILKSTLRHLIGMSELDGDLRSKLIGLHRSLPEIEDIRLNRLLFRRVQLHSNNRFYRFLLNVCELVVSASLLDEETGDIRFRNFVRDERKMAVLFETFLRNFYRTERHDLDVHSEQLRWAATSDTDPDLTRLPSMTTDISVRGLRRPLIIDAKYYTQTLTSYHGSSRVHSANLYQLFAYLRNLEAADPAAAGASGMLLYPEIDTRLRESYALHGHSVVICTVDLSQDWRGIRAELLELLDFTATGQTSVAEVQSVTEPRRVRNGALLQG